MPSTPRRRRCCARRAWRCGSAPPAPASPAALVPRTRSLPRTRRARNTPSMPSSSRATPRLLRGCWSGRAFGSGACWARCGTTTTSPTRTAMRRTCVLITSCMTTCRRSSQTTSSGAILATPASWRCPLISGTTSRTCAAGQRARRQSTRCECHARRRRCLTTKPAEHLSGPRRLREDVDGGPHR